MTEKKTTVLVVDDDPDMQEILSLILDEWGFDSRVAGDGLEGSEIAESWNPDIVISDVIMPDCSGLDLLRKLKKNDMARPVILITALASVDEAVGAMKGGARDFLTKPLDFSRLHLLLQQAEREVKLRAKTILTSNLRKGTALGDFVGAGLREVYELIENVAASDASAIISGESGTGKELAAKTIHLLSDRTKGPFVAINAAAIPETLIESEVFGHERGSFSGAVATRAGCFELASNGTLFLDEITEMPMSLQPRLLRVLEDGKIRRLGGEREMSFNVRVIAATNRDPKAAILDGRLREDLYYRLNVFTVVLPPLRDRIGDIPLLVRHFIEEFNSKYHRSVEDFRDEAMELLCAYSWPGNVRELRNIVERTVVLAKGPCVEVADLPIAIRNGPPDAPKVFGNSPVVTMADVEKDLILRTLDRFGNNKAETARHLGLDVKTVRNKVKAYRLG